MPAPRWAMSRPSADCHPFNDLDHSPSSYISSLEILGPPQHLPVSMAWTATPQLRICAARELRVPIMAAPSPHGYCHGSEASLEAPITRAR